MSTHDLISALKDNQLAYQEQLLQLVSELAYKYELLEAKYEELSDKVKMAQDSSPELDQRGYCKLGVFSTWAGYSTTSSCRRAIRSKNLSDFLEYRGAENSKSGYVYFDGVKHLKRYISRARA